MNRITRNALLLFTLTSASSFCFAQTGKPSDELSPPPAPAVEYKPNAWKEFVSQEGRFSVRMPAPPKLNRQEADTPSGKVPSYLYVAEDRAGGYMVGYADFPNYSESPDFVRAVLDGVRDKVLASAPGMRLLSEKEITVEGHAGRELLVTNGYLLFRAETFLARGRSYQLLLVTLLNAAFNNGRAGMDAADMTDFYTGLSKRFFGSFKLLPASAATVEPAQAEPILAAPEGEVDRLLKSLRGKGESVFGECAEGATCQPLPDVQGVTAANKDKVVRGKILSEPQPEYPPIAKAARAQGAVQVQVVVDEEGKVIAAQAITGHPLLQAAAVRAAREARFSPPMLDGKPVKVAGVITYHFALK